MIVHQVRQYGHCRDVFFLRFCKRHSCISLSQSSYHFTSNMSKCINPVRIFQKYNCREKLPHIYDSIVCVHTNYMAEWWVTISYNMMSYHIDHTGSSCFGLITRVCTTKYLKLLEIVTSLLSWNISTRLTLAVTFFDKEIKQPTDQPSLTQPFVPIIGSVMSLSEPLIPFHRVARAGYSLDKSPVHRRALTSEQCGV